MHLQIIERLIFGFGFNTKEKTKERHILSLQAAVSSHVQYRCS